MNRPESPAKDGYTREERLILASIRAKSGRTCRNCSWLVSKGGHRGCFPEGAYRKWLSADEFNSGCDQFVARGEKK